MDVEITFSPAFALAEIRIGPGSEVKAEAGGMTSMSAASRSRPR